MKKKIILLFLIFLSFKNVFAEENFFCIKDFCYKRENCWEDTLLEVSRDGEILIMLSGNIYETWDTWETSLWLPPADVLICKIIIKQRGKIWKVYEIRNLEEDSEEVWAYKIK